MVAKLYNYDIYGTGMKLYFVDNPFTFTSFRGSHVLDMTMSLYLFLDMYLHSGEYHVGTVGIDIRNYIFAVLMR